MNTTRTLRIKSGSYNVMTSKPRVNLMTELAQQYEEYQRLLSYLTSNDRVLPTTAKALSQQTNRLEATIGAIEKRGNVLLTMALREAGMEGYIGKWTINIDRDPKRMLSDATIGKVRFILVHDHKHRWKGNILRCPLLRIMRMEFPTDWLHMSTKQVQQQMCQRLK